MPATRPCAQTGSWVSPLPPDLLLYEVQNSATTHLLAANLDRDHAHELAWYSDHALWIAPDLDGALTSDMGGDHGNFSSPLAAPDYDGDGEDNLLVNHHVEVESQIYDYTLGKVLDLELAPWVPVMLVAADIDGDGYDDLAGSALAGTNGVLRGSPMGFADQVSIEGITASNFARFFAVGDLDGDGSDDLAACVSLTNSTATAEHSGGVLQLYLSSDRRGESWPARWAWERQPLSEGDGPGSDGYLGYAAGSQVAAADVDGDGVRELVALSTLADGSYSDHDVTVLGDLLSPSGPRVLAFQSSTVQGAPVEAAGDLLWNGLLTTLGDLDGDGDDELLYGLRIVDAALVSGQVLTQVGPTLELPAPGDSGEPTATDLSRVDLALGDFDGDGIVDVACSWGSPDSRIGIWFGTSLLLPEARATGTPSGTSRTCGCGTTPGGGAGLVLLVTVLLACRREAGPCGRSRAGSGWWGAGRR